MSDQLFDLKRLKITRATHAWLQGVSRLTGQPAQEIARDALHKAALADFDKSSVLHRLDPREGLFRDEEDNVGDKRGRGR